MAKSSSAPPQKISKKLVIFSDFISETSSFDRYNMLVKSFFQLNISKNLLEGAKKGVLGLF